MKATTPLRLLTVFAATAALVGPLASCGGGDSSTPAPAPAVPAPPAVVYTQAQITTSAKLAASTATIINGSMPVPLSLAAGIVYGAASSTAGSQTINGARCDTGTFDTTTVKAAARSGFAAGDRVNVVFNACQITVDGVTTTTNGAVSVTVSADTRFNGETAPYDIPFQVNFTNFASTIASTSTVFNGGGNARVNSSTTFLASLAVPAGGNLSARTGTLTLTYGAGFAFTATDGGSGSTGSLRVDGPVNAAVSGVGGVPLVLATPTALTGVTNSSGVITPTAGELRLNQPAPALTILPGASSTTVRGDTNGDGSLDLSFVTTWLALFQ
jgi:hypothetical protein